MTTKDTANPKPAPLSGDELRAFSTAVLRGIGAPDTDWTLDWMARWAASENTLATFNPLATERPMPGHDSQFNAQGVRNYDSLSTGIDATVDTLRLSYYKPIVKALREQRVTNLKGILKAYQTWAGVTAPEEYAIARALKGGWTPSGARTRQSVVVTSGPQRPVVGAHAAKAAQAMVATGAATGAVLLADALSTDWSPFFGEVTGHHWQGALAILLATPVVHAAFTAFTAWLRAKE